MNIIIMLLATIGIVLTVDGLLDLIAWKYEQYKVKKIHKEITKLLEGLK